MNVETGATYGSFGAALAAGEDPKDVVEVHGTPEQAERLSRSVQQANRKATNRAANKRARKSRRANR